MGHADDGAPASHGDNDGEVQPIGFAWAVFACVLTTALVLPLRGVLAEGNLVLLYLMAVVIVTVRLGRRAGVLASIMAVLAFDVFLVPPYLSLTVADSQYLITFGVMLGVSLTISHLAADLRHQALIARHRERRASALFELTRELASALGNDQIGEIGVRYLGETFHARCVLLLPDAQGRLGAPCAGHGATMQLPDAESRIARLVYEREVAIGHDEGITVSAGVRYLPLRAPMRTRGVLVLIPFDAAQRHNREQERQLQTCAAQIALALERVHYADVAHAALLAIESERLRNSLLSAMSHDIRTPLTAIAGMAGTLADGGGLPAGTRQELAEAIRDNALRMNRLVTNLLDMARLQAGVVTLNRQWQMLEEVAGSALSEVAPALAQHRVEVALPASLPLLEFDAVLLERVLCNLLDNAAKYTPPGSTIALTARTAGADAEIAIEDNGPGIAVGKEDEIFSTFSRGEAESARGGVGLGLAICRAVIAAHGGTIRAENRPQGGARFAFTLPLGVAPCDDGAGELANDGMDLPA